MKFVAATLTAAFLIVSAQAGENPGGRADFKITVCMEAIAAPQLTAKLLTTSMFAAIGVTLDWRRGFSRCPSRSILISVEENTPSSLLPGSLAYALPYEGTHIRVFYDRIAHNYSERLVPHLMAHVLAHEITHILEGISRHSASGIMKAKWGEKDYHEMEVRSLEFADEDLVLIYRGLAARERSLLMHPQCSYGARLSSASSGRVVRGPLWIASEHALIKQHENIPMLCGLSCPCRTAIRVALLAISDRPQPETKVT